MLTKIYIMFDKSNHIITDSYAVFDNQALEVQV